MITCRLITDSCIMSVLRMNLNESGPAIGKIWDDFDGMENGGRECIAMQCRFARPVSMCGDHGWNQVRSPPSRCRRGRAKVGSFTPSGA